jgi:hypothetical protein
LSLGNPNAEGAADRCYSISVVSPTPGSYVELANNLSLTQIQEKYWKSSKPLEMYYKLKDTVKNNESTAE